MARRHSGIALLGVLVLLWSQPSRAGDAQAPDWPNALSEAGRRAAMALPPSSPFHLAPTLADLEDAERAEALQNAKTRYDAWVLAAGTPPNVRANNPAGDQGNPPAADTQSECGIAAFGNNVVVAWNDSKGLRLGTPTTVTSYAYSCDGGATFTDGGNVPLIAVGHQSFGDCTLDVDASGNFYMGVIYVSATQDVAVYRGTFSGCSFTWNTPVIAASGAAGALDKPYLCVDRTNGNVYVSYTRFPGGAPAIDVVRGTSLGTVWSAPVLLEAASGNQGSRCIIGPEGNLYVCWQAGWGALNCDLSSTTGSIRLRRSTNPAGAFTFGAAVTVGTVQHNWLSYWAGNLRNNALYFPDMAVDRSGGVNHGRLYVGWNEAAPWGPPGGGTGVSMAETESNNNATDVNVKTINPGDNATGTISSSTDSDYWKIDVTTGQHVLMRLEPQGFNCGVTGTTRNFRIRMYKGISGTQGDSVLAQSNLNGFASEIVFDANETATYFFRIQNINSAGTTTGTYSVVSRLITYGAPAPARDMRDVVVARSTNLGLSFQPEVLVNNDAANLDNCIPAMACDNLGKLHVFWYDARNALGSRILRSYFRGVSMNGGVSFAFNQRVSNQLQYFNLNTVAVPNYGEYNQACATGNTVFASWSDERLSQAGTGGSGVDAYVAKLASCTSGSCAPDDVVQSGQTVILNLCITNCGSFTDDFNYSASDNQGWATPQAGTVAIPAGGSSCILMSVTVPPATPNGTVSVVALSATAASCPAATANCVTNLTVQNPMVGLPNGGWDCHPVNAVLNLELYGQAGATFVGLSGDCIVRRDDPIPLGPGFEVPIELVELSLTGTHPTLGPMTLRESGLYPSGGSITTPPMPFFPADSFFDVFTEIDLGPSIYLNRNRLRVAGTVNGIPMDGATFLGDDILLHKRGTTESLVIGRILSLQIDLGPSFACYPPVGLDCLNTIGDFRLTIPPFGTELIAPFGTQLVARGNAFDPGGGQIRIDTEMVGLSLLGNGAMFGPLRVTEWTGQASLGANQQQTAGIPYPMDSFFDVFYVIELPNLGVQARCQFPAHLEVPINAIPPLGSNYLISNPPVPLLDVNTSLQVGTLDLAQMTKTSHAGCLPRSAFECYRATSIATIEILGLGTAPVNLTGEAALVRADPLSQGNGQITIPCEMLQLDLTGNAPLFGNVTLRKNPNRAGSGGFVNQQLGAPFPLDSFFDVFFQVELPATTLRTASPVNLVSTAGLPSLPTPPGTAYQAVNLPLDLFDSVGVLRGRVLSFDQTTGPLCTFPVTEVPEIDATDAFFGLRSAYPNPFTGETRVSLDLDRERHVSLQVFNVRGERVRTVVDATLGAGRRVLSWDGRNEAGVAVGSGLYFYRVTVDDRSVTRKLVRMQ